MKFCAVLLALALGVSAPAKTPITHEKVWLMKRVGAPALSPDGRWAVVSVGEPAYDSSQQVSDLWLLATDGTKPPKRLTNTKAPESGTAWSPDSTQIAFSTKREGDDTQQIYILPMDGGEAWRLTKSATGAAGPLWRPDGKAILFQSSVFDGAVSEEENAKVATARKARKYNARVWDSYPIARWDKWMTDSHPHLFVQSTEPGAKPKDLLAGTKLRGEAGFAARGTADGSEDLDPAWSPDGRSVVFVATKERNRDTYAFTSTHLYRVDAGGGEPDAITSGADSYTDPVFSPDGKALYASYDRRAEDMLYTDSRIAKFSWPNAAKPEVLGAAFDRGVDRFRISPDGQILYFTAVEQGREKVFQLPASGGDVRPLSSTKSGVYGALEVAGAASAPVIIATWQSMISPSEVVRLDLNTGEHTFLSSFARADAAEIDWQPPREFWFTSKAGSRIHNFVVLPPAFDESKKYPLLVFMHGGPHQPWTDQFFLRWNYHLLASPGYIVLMTNYTGSPGYGEKFAADIEKNILRGPASEINEAADEAIRLFPFVDATRQAAVGASYGGYLANWMEGNTTRYKCLVSHAGLSNNISMWGTTDGSYYWEKYLGGPVWEGKGNWQDQNPLLYAANFKTPMLVTHGGADLRVPVGQGLEMFKLLQRQKVPSRLIVFPEENHWIANGENARFFFEEVFAWLKKYLG